MDSVAHVRRPSYLIRCVRAQLRPLDIRLETVEQVLSRYNLRLLHCPRNVSVGQRSRNVVLCTSQGKMVLKCYRKNWRGTSVTYSHSIVAHLSQVGVPATRLVRTHTGATSVRLDDFQYALFEFVPGINYTTRFLSPACREELLAIAGKTLAQFHERLEGFVPEGHHHLGFRSYHHDRHRDTAWHSKTVKELRDRTRQERNLTDQRFADRLVHESDRLIDEYCLLNETLTNASLPRRIIHGDYGLHNILFDQHSNATLTDFELSRIEWRLSEFVLLISRMRRDGLRRLLAAYQQQSPWTAEEREMLPQVWRFRKLRGVIQAWKSFFEPGATHKLRFACQQLRQVNWAYEHRDHLWDLLDGTGT